MMISSIYDDIDRAEIFITVITKNFDSHEDPYATIRERTHYAIEIGKPVYALVEEGCEIQDYLKPHIVVSQSYNDRESALRAVGKLGKFYKWRSGL